MNLFFSNFLKKVQPADLVKSGMEIETPNVSWFPCRCDRDRLGMSTSDIQNNIQHITFSLLAACFMEIGGHVLVFQQKGCVPWAWRHDPGGGGCRPALLFLHGASTCQYIYFPRNLALGHSWLAGKKMQWFVKNSLFWHPLAGYSLGRQSTWALSCFYGS